MAPVKLVSTPVGAVRSDGVQSTAEPCLTTTIRFAPLPLVHPMVIWSTCTPVKARADACVVGSEATMVCRPPAVVEPVFVAFANRTFVVATAGLTWRLAPMVAVGEMSAVMKM